MIQFVGKNKNDDDDNDVDFRFVLAVLVSIVELFLHVDLYRRQCLSIREQISPCQMLLMQMSGAACVLLHCCFFIFIYIHVTIVVLKQAHGTFNLSNAIRVPCQGE